MEGTVSAPTDARSRLRTWVGQHPGILPLFFAAILGLIIFPAIAVGLKDSDVMINGRVSAIDAVWLVMALVLCVVCLVARSSISNDLGGGLRQLIARTQSSAETVRRTGSASVDTPALGSSIVRGIFDLIVLLVVQGILRTPLVGAVSAYEPTALVDGVFVAVVVLIALMVLFGLYGVVRPLTLYLAAAGLDRVIPTSGFAGGSLPDVSPTRTTTRGSTPSSASRATAQPTIAAGPPVLSDAPTIAAAATIAAPAEATVLASEEPSAEATVAAVPDEAGELSGATIASGGPARPGAPAPIASAEKNLAPLSELPGSGVEQTVVDDRTRAGDLKARPSQPDGDGSGAESADRSSGER